MRQHLAPGTGDAVLTDDSAEGLMALLTRHVLALVVERVDISELPSPTQGFFADARQDAGRPSGKPRSG